MLSRLGNLASSLSRMGGLGSRLSPLGLRIAFFLVAIGVLGSALHLYEYGLSGRDAILGNRRLRAAAELLERDINNPEISVRPLADTLVLEGRGDVVDIERGDRVANAYARGYRRFFPRPEIRVLNLISPSRASSPEPRKLVRLDLMWLRIARASAGVGNKEGKIEGDDSVTLEIVTERFGPNKRVDVLGKASVLGTDGEFGSLDLAGVFPSSSAAVPWTRGRLQYRASIVNPRSDRLELELKVSEGAAESGQKSLLLTRSGTPAIVWTIERGPRALAASSRIQRQSGAMSGADSEVYALVAHTTIVSSADSNGVSLAKLLGPARGETGRGDSSSLEIGDTEDSESR